MEVGRGEHIFIAHKIEHWCGHCENQCGGFSKFKNSLTYITLRHIPKELYPTTVIVADSYS